VARILQLRVFVGMEEWKDIRMLSLEAKDIIRKFIFPNEG
jgi:hypothetical protein